MILDRFRGPSWPVTHRPQPDPDEWPGKDREIEETYQKEKHEQTTESQEG
jgi:hypothetical protein